MPPGNKDGESQGIYIANLGRLSRLLTIQEAILAKVWQLGGEVVTVESGIVPKDDPDDPMRTAMRQMATIYELDKKMVVKRLRDGRKYKASIGGHAVGASPYGAAAVEGDLIPVESEALAIKRMVALRDSGSSLRQIVTALDSEGIRTKKGKRLAPDDGAAHPGKAEHMEHPHRRR